MAMAGEAHGIVTGPAHKPALRAAGVDVPGHTELLQQLTEAPYVGMLMAAEVTRVGAPLRVLLATTHLPLRDVPRTLTTQLLVDQTRLLHTALRRDWRLDRPRIALCAFNPHASDDGLFGDEEKRIYEPAVGRLRDEGLTVSPALPADTVFSRALAGEFDAVVAPYHDVGMAAFKTLSFGAGVNVTLGLPFVRTSPDHGTAFDLVGTGRADPTSTRNALRLAVELARARLDL
jgi:4-hydroxythreonine-4-phosphate dehydrogenase